MKVKKEEQTKIEEILEKIGQYDLSPKEKIYLVYRILDQEYRTPRTQKEIEKRNEALEVCLNLILEEHFSPLSFLTLIAKLGQNLLEKHPELRQAVDNSHNYTI